MQWWKLHLSIFKKAVANELKQDFQKVRHPTEREDSGKLSGVGDFASETEKDSQQTEDQVTSHWAFIE